MQAVIKKKKKKAWQKKYYPILAIKPGNPIKFRSVEANVREETVVPLGTLQTWILENSHLVISLWTKGSVEICWQTLQNSSAYWKDISGEAIFCLVLFLLHLVWDLGTTEFSIKTQMNFSGEKISPQTRLHLRCSFAPGLVLACNLVIWSFWWQLC